MGRLGKRLLALHDISSSMVASAPTLQRSYDYIVVGGGSAGCVLARRLAEDATATVLLIEAGPSDEGVAAIDEPGAWVSLMGGMHDWCHAYAPGPHIGGRVVPIPRGKVLGGSSSTNAMLWYRGHPGDYDAWHEAGATGWNHAALLPYFRALRGLGGRRVRRSWRRRADAHRAAA